MYDYCTMQRFKGSEIVQQALKDLVHCKYGNVGNKINATYPYGECIHSLHQVGVTNSETPLRLAKNFHSKINHVRF